MVDTNIVFSALIAGGKTREAILASDLYLAVPEFFYSELNNNRPSIREKTGLSDTDFNLLISLLFSELAIVPRDDFRHTLGEARDIMNDIDPDDVPFIALALQQECAIWSDDGHFKEQEAVPVWTTSDLLDHLGFV